MTNMPMRRFNPRETYAKIRKREQEPLKFLYLSVPLGWPWNREKERSLRQLTDTKLVFLKERKLLGKIIKSKRLRGENFDAVVSLSRRGLYVYRNLKKGLKELRDVAHYSLKISRKHIRSFRFPDVRGKRILVVDDIFCSGLTLNAIIARLRKDVRVTCLFLFGPTRTIREFVHHHPRVTVVAGSQFTADPRTISMDATDLDSFLRLKREFGSRSVLLRRAFGANTSEAVRVIKGKA